MNPEDKDKFTAAFHEAGHVVVAVAVGCQRVTAELRRNESGGHDELHWIGRTGYRDGSASQEAEAAIGWAGKAAELILTNGEFCEWWFDQIDDMSPTDRELVEDREDWTDDCTRAVDILKQQWNAVERVAHALIADEELTDLQIINLIEQEKGGQEA